MWNNQTTFHPANRTFHEEFSYEDENDIFHHHAEVHYNVLCTANNNASSKIINNSSDFTKKCLSTAPAPSPASIPIITSPSSEPSSPAPTAPNLSVRPDSSLKKYFNEFKRESLCQSFHEEDEENARLLSGQHKTSTTIESQAQHQKHQSHQQRLSHHHKQQQQHHQQEEQDCASSFNFFEENSIEQYYEGYVHGEQSNDELNNTILNVNNILREEFGGRNSESVCDDIRSSSSVTRTQTTAKKKFIEDDLTEAVCTQQAMTAGTATVSNQEVTVHDLSAIADDLSESPNTAKINLETHYLDNTETYEKESYNFHTELYITETEDDKTYQGMEDTQVIEEEDEDTEENEETVYEANIEETNQELIINDQSTTTNTYLHEDITMSNVTREQQEELNALRYQQEVEEIHRLEEASYQNTTTNTVNATEIAETTTTSTTVLNTNQQEEEFDYSAIEHQYQQRRHHQQHEQFEQRQQLEQRQYHQHEQHHHQHEQHHHQHEQHHHQHEQYHHQHERLEQRQKLEQRQYHQHEQLEHDQHQKLYENNKNFNNYLIEHDNLTSADLNAENQLDEEILQRQYCEDNPECHEEENMRKYKEFFEKQSYFIEDCGCNHQHGILFTTAYQNHQHDSEINQKKQECHHIHSQSQIKKQQQLQHQLQLQQQHQQIQMNNHHNCHNHNCTNEVTSGLSNVKSSIDQNSNDYFADCNRGYVALSNATAASNSSVASATSSSTNTAVKLSESSTKKFVEKKASAVQQTSLTKTAKEMAKSIKQETASFNTTEKVDNSIKASNTNIIAVKQLEPNKNENSIITDSSFSINDNKETSTGLFKQSDFVYDKSKKRLATLAMSNESQQLNQMNQSSHSSRRSNCSTSAAVKEESLDSSAIETAVAATNSKRETAIAVTNLSHFNRNSSHDRSHFQKQQQSQQYQQQQQQQQQQQRHQQQQQGFKRFSEVKLNFLNNDQSNNAFAAFDAKKSFAAFNSNGLQQQHHKQEAKFASQSNNMYLGGSATQLHSHFSTASGANQHQQSAAMKTSAKQQDFFIDSECCDALIQNIASLHNLKQQQKLKERKVNSLSMGSLVGAGIAGSSTINSSKKVCNEMSSQRSLAFNHNGTTASAHHHSVINSTNSSSMGNMSKAGTAEVVEVIHCVDRHNPNGYFFDLAQQENIFDDDQKRAYKIIFKKYN